MSGFFPDARKAAKTSWILPLIVIVVSLAYNNSRKEHDFERTAAIVQAAAIALCSLGGLVLAIGALFSVQKLGRVGILAPAIAGTVLNGLVLFFLVAGFLLAINSLNSDKWSTYETDGANFKNVYEKS